jgi:hypothetical protein
LTKGKLVSKEFITNKFIKTWSCTFINSKMQNL